MRGSAFRARAHGLELWEFRVQPCILRPQHVTMPALIAGFSAGLGIT